ncbi:hypothetical protein Peur_046793 [Populus x canadensis]
MANLLNHVPSLVLLSLFLFLLVSTGCGDADDGSKTLPEAKQILVTVLVNARRCKGQFMELAMHSSQDLHVSATSTVNQVLNSMPE